MGLRDALRRLLELSDRLSHPLRRSRARRALRRAGPWTSVLFLCHGNICRSPFAARVLLDEFARREAPRLDVSSAGFFGPDRASPPLAREVASKRGVDLDDHRSRLVSDELVREADLFVVMSSDQRRRLVHEWGVREGSIQILGHLDPEPWERSAIEDPYGKDIDVFDRVYARIERCVMILADDAAA